jgi:tetratricopeptide (TPR) repeat protein
MSFRSRARTSSSLVLLSIIVALIAGCTRDLNIRKQKYLASGNRYFDQGKYREAAIQYLNAIQIDKNFGDAHYRLAQSYLRQGIWAGAYQELMSTTELQPDNIKAQIDLGTVMLSTKQFQQAREHAQNILSRDRNNVDAHMLLANSYAGFENVGESLREMQTAISLAPDQPRVYLNMAYLQLNAKQSVAAEQDFLKAIELDPKSVPARLAIGNFYVQQKRWKEAEGQLREALLNEPRNPVPYAAMASLFDSQNEPNEAEHILLQAVAKVPNDAGLYMLLGQMQLNLSDYAAAERSLTKALELNPNSLDAILSLTRTQIARGSIEQAVESFQKAIRQNPGDIRAYILLGSLQESKGNWQEAEQQYQKLFPCNQTIPLQRIISLISFWNTAATQMSPCHSRRLPAA